MNRDHFFQKKKYLIKQNKEVSSVKKIIQKPLKLSLEPRDIFAGDFYLKKKNFFYYN